MAWAGCAGGAAGPVAAGKRPVDVGATFGIRRTSEVCVTTGPSKLQRALAISKDDLAAKQTCRATTETLPIVCSAPCKILGGHNASPLTGAVKLTGAGWLGVSFAAPGDYTVYVGQRAYPVSVRATTALRARLWQDDDYLYIEAIALAGASPLQAADPEIFVAGEARDTEATRDGVRAKVARSDQPRHVQIYYRGFYLEATR